MPLQLTNKKHMADITYLTVRHQLNAFSEKEYEVGLLNRSSEGEKGSMLCRDFNKSQVLNSIPWFKHMNGNNHDVFIRPKGSVGLIFFDDVTQSTIEKMKNDGCEPALIIESSPHNYHGWVRVSNIPIEPKLATQCAKVIANKYRADQNSADYRHFGRLAGFTNVKPKYVGSTGLYPFVKLTSRRGKIATNSKSILFSAQKRLDKIEMNSNNIVFEQNLEDMDKALSLAKEKYAAVIEYYSSHVDYDVNYNAVDWQVAKYLAELGYKQSVIADCLLDLSPNLGDRKGIGRETSYINRTLVKLFSL